MKGSMITQPLSASPELPLSVRAQLAGRHILLTGITGFVGKVLFTLIAAVAPEVRRVSVLIRPGKGHRDAAARFRAEVMTSEPFEALRARLGAEAFEAWVAARVNPVTGDITQERMGLSAADYDELTHGDALDLILHCAGNVNFDPPLDEALEVNTLGVTHKLELARDAGCPLVHMSTCFVVGERSGPVPETGEVVDYTPKGVPSFSAEREVLDAVDAIARWRREADSQVMQEAFRQEAVSALRKRDLDSEHEGHLAQELRAARRRWLNDRLRDEGMDRAKRWGWTNTYTYTKSLGEQLTVSRAQGYGVPVAIVRPAIVESAHSFPFPGWNEGVNTCAPIVYLYWKGQRFTPSNPDNILDVIPVDWVCQGTLLAAAELLEGRSRGVYQLSTGEANPLTMRRAIELTNLAWRARYDRDFSFFERHLMRNLDTVAVSKSLYERAGAPAAQRVARGVQGLLKALPAPARALLRPAEQGAKALERAAGMADKIFGIFAPFILENNPKFSAAHTQAAAARLVPEEREALGFPLASLDWRHYWMQVHMEGLQRWVFGELDERVKRVRAAPRAGDLVALLRNACVEHEHERALQLFGEGGVEVTYTYGDLWRGALAVAGGLRAAGVRRGDAVVLLSPNEPAWPMAYLGGLLADATVVPADPELAGAELGRIVRKSEAAAVLAHEEHLPSLASLECEAWAAGRAAEGRALALLTLGEAFAAAPLRDEEVSRRDRSAELASLLFTSGTTGDPKGVMLTHANFCALLSSLHGVFSVSRRDRFLSVLPLFHTFEFSAGFLLPMSVGARVTYLTALDGATLRAAMRAVRPTGIIGIPALWDVLQKRIESQVKDKGEAASLLFKLSVKANRALRAKGLNAGPLLFGQVHESLGGSVRYLISGGAALSESTLEVFEGLGFELLEGYGLTEAAPVLAVRRPKSRRGAGTVGRPVPGVELKIKDPDASGVGEVLARGDNVMVGYLNDPEGSARALRGGWLHTGDLGALNARGELTLSGRSKELIVTSSGKNVYPDDLEPIFAAHEHIEELAIVGIPDPQGDERVAALVVLKAGAPEEAQREVRAHISTINALRPDHQRLRTFRFWPEPLPRTPTRKVRRAEVRAELLRLLEIGRAARRAEQEGASAHEPAWLYSGLAGLCGVELLEVQPDSHLTTDLGLSSLQLVELRLLIEESLGRAVDGARVARAERVRDLAALALERGGAQGEEAPAEEARPLWRDLPEPVRAAGRALIDAGRHVAFSQLFQLDVRGQENLPLNQQVIVISNHSSHLDIGLIKEALGPLGAGVGVLAAQDYFFDTEYKEALLSQFTRLIPVDRGAPLERSMREAEEAVARGWSVLIYPEGTRSPTGELQEFKAGVGYLQHKTGLPVLPLYLSGTHKAMPKGGGLPRFGRRLSARVGRLVTAEVLAARCEGKRRHEVYQEITDACYEAVVALRDGKPYPWEVPPGAPAEEDAGVTPLFEHLEARFSPTHVKSPITWYFSLGEGSDDKWTLSVTGEAVRFYPGKPQGGAQADCVLKTDMRTFERMVREGYVPSMAEFASGKVKTNNPQHLFAFKSIFSL
ncbi:MAG: AMP-binding protein [Deltaproteobacteria bacterium]|nr:AMP-binding protein [Deltaproteobacteria bacterium]